MLKGAINWLKNIPKGAINGSENVPIGAIYAIILLILGVNYYGKIGTCRFNQLEQ